MTESKTTVLRDARLDAALQHMPDAQMKAGASTRQAVLRAAHEAVQPISRTESSKNWWRKLFSSSQPNMPWRAGFATVLIAGFTGLLYQHRDETETLAVNSSETATASVSASAPLSAPAANIAKPAQDSASEVKLKKSAPQTPISSPEAERATQAATPAVSIDARSEKKIRAEVALPAAAAAALAPAPAAATKEDAITLNQQRSASGTHIDPLQLLLDKLNYTNTEDAFDSAPVYQLTIKPFSYRIYRDVVVKKNGDAVQSSPLSTAQFAQIQRLIAESTLNK